VVDHPFDNHCGSTYILRLGEKVKILTVDIRLLNFALNADIFHDWLSVYIYVIGSCYIKSTHFRGKIVITITDFNSILQTCWVSLGIDIMQFNLSVFINCRITSF
jgi:hypothetical protein